jgi:GNAT superfamily N-acetyltransferase
MTPHERLERATWDLFWLPADVEVTDRPELLLIRCRRPVQLLNTVLRSSATAARIDAVVAEARAAHAHTVSRWCVPDTRPRAHVEAALERGGYAPGHRHEARLVEVARFRPRPGGDFTVRAVDSLSGMRHGVDVVNQAFGRAEGPSEEELARDVAMCTGPGARIHRFVGYDASGAPVVSGSMTVFSTLRFGFLWGGGTIPSARGRGAYSALLAARVAQARALGLEYVGLYARTTTSAPIVARQGFERWGEMTYWESPPPEDLAGQQA